MTIDPTKSPTYAKQQQYLGQIEQGSQQAAQAMLQGAQDFRQAIPGARQQMMGAAGNALAAGAAQAGRQGGSAYGGALQGGLMGAQQAAQFDLSAAQQLADMQSQAYATQAAAAGKMLELGTPQQMQQQQQMQIQSEINNIITNADKWWGYKDSILNEGFNRLRNTYANDPYMLAFIDQQQQAVMQAYG